MPVCVLISEKGVREKEVDDSPNSDFTSKTLGGSVTIVGSWDDSRIILLGLTKHRKKKEIVPASLLPSTNREKTLFFPLMITRLNDRYDPINFTIEDYEKLILSENKLN